MLKKLWLSIAKMFDFLESKTKKFIPVGVNFVERLKTFIDGPIDDIIIGIIDDYAPSGYSKLANKAHKWLEDVIPRLAFQLRILQDIEKLNTQEEKINYIISTLKTWAKNEKYPLVDLAEIAADCAIYLSDGKLSQDEKNLLKIDIKEYYNKHVKK